MRERDAAVCVVCGRGPDLLVGALVRYPGVHRWIHRKCLEADVALARTTAKRVQRALTFRERQLTR